MQLFGGSGNCGDSLAKGKLIRMAKGERTLKLFCLMGEGLPCCGCCSRYCIADPPPREASAIPTLTPFKVLWVFVCIYRYRLRNDWWH